MNIKKNVVKKKWAVVFEVPSTGHDYTFTTWAESRDTAVQTAQDEFGIGVKIVDVTECKEEFYER